MDNQNQQVNPTSIFTVVIPGNLPLQFVQENDYFITELQNPGNIPMIT